MNEETGLSDENGQIDEAESGDETAAEVVEKPGAETVVAKKPAVKKKAAAPKSAASKIAAKQNDAETETEVVAKPLRGEPRQFTVTARSLVQAGIALVVVALLVVVGIGGWQLYEKNAELNAFDDAKAASSAFVQTYFGTVMSKDASPESVIAKVVPLSTGEARERVESEAKSNVSFVQQAKLENIEIKVNAATVESFTKKTATTILAVAIKGTSAQQPAGGQQFVLLQLDLAKQDGKWLVSRMTSVDGMTMNADDQTQTQTQTPEATTPAPAPTG
ncbi:MAG: hypothetical protein QM658_00710 [Gordonia sp. (in: high G+C Gram-positive bacteria)]